MRTEMPIRGPDIRRLARESPGRALTVPSTF